MADIIGSYIKTQVKPSHSESLECALELSELTPHLKTLRTVFPGHFNQDTHFLCLQQS